MSLVDAVRPDLASQQRRAFFSPTIDFFCLGGGSLLLLPILIWGIPDDVNPRSLGLGILMSTFINQPHFAHSYQIFYRTFRVVVFEPGSDRTLRARYLWAGVGAPLLLVLFLAGDFAWGDARTLGLAANAMIFISGWHYAKQGYGVLMVDAALRRSFFSEVDKKFLLANAYVCWIVSWLAANKAVAQRDLWGLSYATFELPIDLLWLGGALLATTLLAAWILVRHALGHRGRVPIAGTMAYCAALYPWLFMIREPVLGILIPTMHSLQYMVIVWRYELNLQSARPDATAPLAVKIPAFTPTKATLRVAGFVARGMILGMLGFWALPTALGKIVPYDHAQYGDYLFFFVLFVFINIHHYFIDNAMWRKENPHTLRHLLAHG